MGFVPMMYLFSLFITYFGYVITPPANHTPAYVGKKKPQPHGWVLIVRPKGGCLGKARSLFLTAREGREVGGSPASGSFIDPA